MKAQQLIESILNGKDVVQVVNAIGDSDNTTHYAPKKHVRGKLNEEDRKGSPMSNEALWTAFENMKEALGTDELLGALARAIGSWELQEMLEAIGQDYEMMINQQDGSITTAGEEE